MLEKISQILIQIVDSVGAFGIAIAGAVESFFPPIPSEIIMVSAGLSASAAGGIGLILLYSIAGAIGNFVGTLPFYLISFYGAKTFLPKFLNKWGKFLLISNDDLKRAEKLFKKRGNITVFLSKLIPGIRSLIAFPAGVAKMNFASYMFYSLAGSTVWNIFLVSIGYAAYEQKDEIFAILKPIETLILILIVIAILTYATLIFLNFRKQR